MAEYYIGINNKQLGPFPVDKLLLNGVKPDTLVWCSGMPGWEKAKDVPELAPLFVAPPPAMDLSPQYQQYQEPAYQQPQYQQPVYPQYPQYQPQYAQGNMPPKPDNNMVWAILSTVLCCLPAGIVAIIKASKVDNLYMRGDYQGAEEAAKSAKTWAIVGAVAGLVFGILYVIFVVFLGVMSNGFSNY